MLYLILRSSFTDQKTIPLDKETILRALWS